MSLNNLLLLLSLVLIGWYLSFLASRLDRLHHRVETSWATLDLPTISYEIRTPTCARQVTGRCTDQRNTNHTGAEGIRRRASHIGAERLAMRDLRSTWRRGGLAEGWPCAARRT
ncbi:MAG: hypothetical protein RL237_795, partial [Actinomycetota bacterium]